MCHKNANEMKKQWSHLSDHHAAEGGACDRNDPRPSSQLALIHIMERMFALRMGMKWTRRDDLPLTSLRGIRRMLRWPFAPNLLLQSGARIMQNQICIKFKKKQKRRSFAQTVGIMNLWVQGVARAQFAPDFCATRF